MVVYKVFQIYYSDEQKPTLLDGFSHFKNVQNDIFLENAVLMRIFNKIKNENFHWFGGFSHKVCSKIGNHFNYQYLKNKINKHSNSDIICPNPKNIKESNLLQNPHHPRILHEKSQNEGFWECIDLIFKKLNIPNLLNGNHLDQEIDMIYFNYFVIKKDLFADYMNNLLLPAINLMQFDEDVIKLCNMSSPHNNRPFPEHLKKETGYLDWPHIPFILERLINIYRLTYDRKTAFVL